MTHRRLAATAAAFSLCLFITGCGRVQQTLAPMAADRLGTRTEFIRDRFRICGPEFDRSVTPDPVTPPAATEVVAGFNNHIRGGLTCDTQESFGYNGLVHFDQAALQGKIVISARLRADRRNTNLPVHVAHASPSGPIDDFGCNLLVRTATATWPAGRSSGGIANETLFRSGDESSSHYVQQTSVIGASVDVTEVVRQWALGRKANNGFVIMAQPGSLAKNENSCTGYWSNPRLELTVLDFPH